MRAVKNIGLVVFLIGFLTFTGSMFLGSYRLSNQDWQKVRETKGWPSEVFIADMEANVVDKQFGSMFGFSGAIISALKNANAQHDANQEWDKKIYDQPSELVIELGRMSTDSPVKDNKGFFFLLTFGLGVLGALIFILPDVKLLGPPGIKNNGIYHSAAMSRGWVGWLAFVWFVSFYLLLYFYPQFILNWIMIADPAKHIFIDADASRWFLYGLMYTIVMTVMGVRMFIKYRHNNYQMVRTASVLLFQIVFAFLLVEILPLFGLPGKDLKNAWPLDYYFLFDWNVKDLIENGNFGKFVFVWGIALALIVVPVLVYFYGKRWYCSWVCGCGGLAETLGDPYRQNSNKTLGAWKLERWVIHAVLLFAVVMTVWTGYHTYNEIHNPNMEGGTDILFGLSAYNIRSWYGLFIGSWFAGVVGTGFYPIFGNRVWCRFGCPLAAYMGLVQRFKSRFRITANGGQCISCGNCSTYCEQGIDVRWYAQRGQNIIRASCVGCGVCAAVCPRGVLKLENGPEEGRINSNPILIGNDSITLDV